MTSPLPPDALAPSDLIIDSSGRVARPFTVGVDFLALSSFTGATITVPQTPSYAAFLVLMYLRGDNPSPDTGTRVQFNNDTGANYDIGFMRENGGALSAGEFFGQTSLYVGEMPGATAPVDSYCATSILVPNYLNTLHHKAVYVCNSAKGSLAAGGSWVHSIAGFWRSDQAITQFELFAAGGNIDDGSRITVYGLGGTPFFAGAPS